MSDFNENCNQVLCLFFAVFSRCFTVLPEDVENRTEAPINTSRKLSSFLWNQQQLQCVLTEQLF